jgi:L-seryl-tRNA(Ser) seleniumtransferase
MDKKDLLRNLPKVDEILNNEDIQRLLNEYPRITVVDSIRRFIDMYRKEIIEADVEDLTKLQINFKDLVNKVILDVEEKNKMSLRRVINATGVILHTNLGRAIISDKVKDKLLEAACNYSTLEFDLSNGRRGSRYAHVEDIICKLTGAEAALVVNNNAAAVLLVLNTVAKGKEVIVSRGQLVEIGGSFRVPEVMAQSGAKLVEVGATNKTHLYDYENNINEETSAILKVHTSNYKILGFSDEVDIEDLVGLAQKYDLPVIEDIGSGTLVDFSKYGLTKEPTVTESIQKGADIVTFSGDKLLGGPQAGIIIGKKKYIDKMKKNQLTRAIRIDKLTLATLEATLRLYLQEDKAIEEIPTLKMLIMDINEIERKADILFNKIKNASKKIEIQKEKGYSQVGGGSMPLEELPTILITLTSKELSVNTLEEKLRSNSIPIITRISNDKIMLDVRTIREDEFDIISNAIESI